MPQPCWSQSGILLAKNEFLGLFPFFFCAQTPFPAVPWMLFQPCFPGSGQFDPRDQMSVFNGKKNSQFLAPAAGNSRHWEDPSWRRGRSHSIPNFHREVPSPGICQGQDFGIKLTLFVMETPPGRRQQRVTLCRSGEYLGIPSPKTWEPPKVTGMA